MLLILLAGKYRIGNYSLFQSARDFKGRDWLTYAYWLTYVMMQYLAHTGKAEVRGKMEPEGCPMDESGWQIRAG